MVEFGITVLVALLIIAVFMFRKRKIASSAHVSSEPLNAPEEPLKKEAKYPPQQEKQSSEIKSADKNAVNVETTAVVNPQITDMKVVPASVPEPTSKIETPAKPQVEEPVSTAKASNTVSPQVADAKVVSTPKPEPVSSPVSKIETPARQQVKEAASAVKTGNAEVIGFPEDSVLKRHYFYHLCTMAEELAPQCPTDSVLRRHHFTTLASRVEQCLHDKKSLEQLISDYEKRSA